MPNDANNFGSIDDLLKTGAQQNQQHTQGPVQEDDVQQPADPRTDEHASKAAKAQAAVDEKMHEFELETKEKEVRDKAALLGLEYIDLTAFPIGPEVLSLIEETQAEQHKVIPFFRLENQIRLAVLDPDEPGVNDIVQHIQQAHDGSHIKLYLISQHSFDNAMKLYKNVAKVKNVEYGVKITADQLNQYQSEVNSPQILERRLQNANMTDAFAMIISMAMNMNSSDVHIEAEETGAIIRFRIDGVLTDIAELAVAVQEKLVSRIKVIAGLKVNITDVPQDGRITIKMGVSDDGEEDELDLRVSALPSAFGESIVFRLLRSSAAGLSFEDLGMRPAMLEKLRAEIEKPNGMVITTGPTGSGKTTTLYAILNKLNSPETKIITLENPIEYKLKGIVQSQIDHERNYTFDKGLRSILRQDPDIVMVGEIRDQETAQTAIDASLTGHLMLSTIHTNDASGVIPRFLGMGIKGIFLAPALNAVIGQRLVRRLCEKCKQPDTTSHEFLQRAKEWIERIPENSGEEQVDTTQVEWFKAVGCGECGDSGYKGRIGIYEVFTMVPKIEKQILSGQVSEFMMKDILHEAGMVTMGQDGLLKAAKGITTLNEVFRVAKA